MHLTNLESDISQIKEDLARVLANNEKLLSSNSKLELELQSVRSHGRTDNDSTKSVDEKAVTKKKKKTKKLSKEVQTELKFSETMVTTDSTKTHVVSKTVSTGNERQVLFKETEISQNSPFTNCATQFRTLPPQAPSDEIPLNEKNWWDKTTTPVVLDTIINEPKANSNHIAKAPSAYIPHKETLTSSKTSDDVKSFATIVKEPKTRSTVPPKTSNTLVNDRKNEFVPAKPNNTESLYKLKQRCLLIHDGFHEGFDETKFSKRYEVKAHKITLLSSLEKEKQNILNKIKETKTDIVFLHVGFRDMWNGHKAKEAAEDLMQALAWLLKKSEVQVCVSLAIPGDGQYVNLDKEVGIFNRTVADHITDLRNDNRYKNRVFTVNNNRLREFMSKSVGAHGTQLVLSNRGKNHLWLRLRDSINRCLELKSPSMSTPQSSLGNSERETYRRKDVSNNFEPRPINSSRNEN